MPNRPLFKDRVKIFPIFDWRSLMIPQKKTLRPRFFLLAVLVVSASASACSSVGRSPEFSLIYNQAAQYERPDRNPVIVIPGILGSRLVDADTGTVVWGAFEPQSANPKSPEGAKLIALPYDGSSSLADLTDSVQPAGVLDRVKLRVIGVALELRAYAGILSTLGAGGYRDESLGLGAIDYGDDHFTCFQFDYDWRRDNVENAKRLKQFIEEKRRYVQNEYAKRFGIEDADVKFDIVAHSMGGLLTRYFLRYGDADLPQNGEEMEVTWAGAEHVDRAILVATPNAGSLLSLKQLIEGADFGRPLVPRYEPALIGTFPSVYQLLPRSRHHAVVWNNNREEPIADLLDSDLWTRLGWGLASPEAERFLALTAPPSMSAEIRREKALAYQRRILERTRAFHQALDKPARPPSGLQIFLVAGDADPTAAVASIDSATGAIEIIELGPGDGTVLRSSALMDERVAREWTPTLNSPIQWSSVMFIFADHLKLTQNPVFSDNVLYWLLEEPRQHAQ
jgi:pimeloyl-ACP methyl ester carboxylesterase